MPSPAQTQIVSDQIHDRAEFEQVRYANCWEDADVLCEAIRPGPGKRILSIASAGDNSLALLASGATVVAADISAPQIACLEFRVAAFRRLNHSTLLGLLGVRPCSDRMKLYQQIEPELSAAAKQHWRTHPKHIERGIIHAGRFENYFRLFRTRVLPLIHSRRRVHDLLAEKSLAAQREFYDRRWNNLRWRIIFRIFFGRMLLGKVGRDPEFMRYVEGNVGQRLLSRVEHGLREVPTHSNPYLDYILNGNYLNTLPRYLREENFERIRSGLDRLIIHCGPIEEAASAHAESGFDGFNLSDIFEYISTAASKKLYGQLLATASPGSRLVYWNTLVPRSCPDEFQGAVVALDETAKSLHARDRAFFYCDFLVDEFRSLANVD